MDELFKSLCEDKVPANKDSEGNDIVSNMPTSRQEAKKVMQEVGFDYITIDACPCNQTLYYGEEKQNLQNCPIWKLKWTLQENALLLHWPKTTSSRCVLTWPFVRCRWGLGAVLILWSSHHRYLAVPEPRWRVARERIQAVLCNFLDFWMSANTELPLGISKL